MAVIIEASEFATLLNWAAVAASSCACAEISCVEAETSSTAADVFSVVCATFTIALPTDAVRSAMVAASPADDCAEVAIAPAEAEIRSVPSKMVPTEPAMPVIAPADSSTERTIAASAVSARPVTSWHAFTSPTPVSIAATASTVRCRTCPMSSAIWRVDSDERSARVRMFSATTAKPRPSLPALAASMAALRARRLVRRAMSSMTATMPPICSP